MMEQGEIMTVTKGLLTRLVRISEAVHAESDTKVLMEADWYLDEAECDCEQCKKRRTESG